MGHGSHHARPDSQHLDRQRIFGRAGGQLQHTIGVDGGQIPFAAVGRGSREHLGRPLPPLGGGLASGQREFPVSRIESHGAGPFQSLGRLVDFSRHVMGHIPHADVRSRRGTRLPKVDVVHISARPIRQQRHKRGSARRGGGWLRREGLRGHEPGEFLAEQAVVIGRDVTPPFTPDVVQRVTRPEGQRRAPRVADGEKRQVGIDRPGRLDQRVAPRGGIHPHQVQLSKRIGSHRPGPQVPAAIEDMLGN